MPRRRAVPASAVVELQLVRDAMFAKPREVSFGNADIETELGLSELRPCLDLPRKPLRLPVTSRVDRHVRTSDEEVWRRLDFTI